jgi:ABC-type antimicrobial peptide transport system permease subunit
VVKNFHYASLRAPIGSFIFESNPTRFMYANLKVVPGTRFADIATMEDTWKKLGRDDKFRAQFFSDEIRDAFSYYFVLVKLWGFLGLLAITVTRLGLLGTVVFTIKNRIKEISIRKVMGASNESLLLLLSRKFFIMMLIASIITLPAIYFMFQKWLLPSVQHYSVEIGLIEFVASVSIMVMIGVATILSQTLRAANTNPVDNLRSE